MWQRGSRLCQGRRRRTSLPWGRGHGATNILPPSRSPHGTPHRGRGKDSGAATQAILLKSKPLPFARQGSLQQGPQLVGGSTPRRAPAGLRASEAGPLPPSFPRSVLTPQQALGPTPQVPLSTGDAGMPSWASPEALLPWAMSDGHRLLGHLGLAAVNTVAGRCLACSRPGSGQALHVGAPRRIRRAALSRAACEGMAGRGQGQLQTRAGEGSQAHLLKGRGGGAPAARPHTQPAGLPRALSRGRWEEQV